MTLRPVQHDNVREHNRMAVLQALRARGVATRAELARDSGLSVPTVTTISSEFIERGVVGEGERVPSAGGRPAQQLNLNSASRNVLALDLSGAYLRHGRLDLMGQLANESAPAQPPLRLGAGAGQQLSDWILRQVQAEAEAGFVISALAVAVPGVVEQRSGRVRLAPALGWSDEPVGQQLSGATGLPVLLENDVNAVALGELLHGAGVGKRNVLYLGIGSGIGAAIVIDGALYRGANSASGEIGYSLLPGLSEQGLDLGASGPFERHLLGIAQEFVVDGRLDLDTELKRAAFQALVDKVRLTLHNLACVLDPELIVVAWSADPQGLLARAVSERWATPLPVQVLAGKLGDRAALRGVGHLALQKVTAGLCGLEEAEWSNP